MNDLWIDIELEQFSFLQPLSTLKANRFKTWIPESEAGNLRRSSADGTWLLRTTGAAQDVAIVWSDFRINGGSYGKNISRRIASFLQECERRSLPLIMVINSLGYRFTEGRTGFNDVFNLIPALDQYSRNQLMITICHGQCLGLGAILFGLGHYRIGVSTDSTLNLTGPDVFRLFFGKKVDFNSFASVDQQHLKTSLVHVRAADLTEAIGHAHSLVRIQSDTRHLPTVNMQPEPEQHLDFLLRQKQRTQRACQILLQPIADRHLELFTDFDSRLRIYLAECDGYLYGLLMNPQENANNMITVRTLKLYQDALTLFSALRVPIISFLDTPGVDPRVDNSNQDIILQLIDANRAIIEYPFPKMGVWVGRGFGGANTLVIPKIYGSVANYVILDRTTLGVMHESIIAHLLEKSKRMLDIWHQSREKETPDFKDIVAAGIVDRAIHLDELRDVILEFLSGETSKTNTLPFDEQDEVIYA